MKEFAENEWQERVKLKHSTAAWWKLAQGAD